jgi:hypothetical protein
MYSGAGVAVRFEIDFYVTETGRAPVLEWLEGLKRRSPNLQALVLAGINKLKDREYHAPPCTLKKWYNGMGARQTDPPLVAKTVGERGSSCLDILSPNSCLGLEPAFRKVGPPRFSSLLSRDGRPL